MHLNVGSMLAKYRVDLLRLQIGQGDFDIFCISETWLTEAIPNGLVNIEGYNIFRVDRSWVSDGIGCRNTTAAPAKKGGGLACYVKKGIYSSETKYGNLNCSTRDLELQCIDIQIPNLRQIVLLNIYRPPQGDYKAACNIINQTINKAGLKSNAEIYLLGDFNIDLKNKKAPATKELLFTTALHGLLPKITTVTRHSSRRGNTAETCIDNIFTNSDLIAEAKTLNLNISDHLAIFVRRKKARLVYKKVAFIGRSYRNFVKEDFQNELIGSDWNEFYEQRDPNKCWQTMEGKIRSILDVTCPRKKFRVREVREPWVTDEILEEINDKDAYLRLAKETGKDDDWEMARRERNRVGKLVRNAKSEFVKEQQRVHRQDPKKFWRVISSVVPNKKQVTDQISLVGKNSCTEVKDDEVADHINNFFSSIGSTLASKLNDPWIFHGEVAEAECQNLHTDYEQIVGLCREINEYKSSGIQDIASRILKCAFLVLVPQLVYLFNLSFTTGIFPELWKRATVIPLFKGGDRAAVENYRPISLLPLPGKLIEKIAHKKIITFLEINNILSNKQSGFRKGFSTASAVADLTDDLFSANNDSEMSIAVFVDVRKAFDTVHHDILCKKLERYGLRGKVLDWCMNYLTNRCQHTVANNVKSEVAPLDYGVPQGSVLGPLFFIMYVNDLERALQGVKVRLYADDTVIYASGSKVEQVVSRLQLYLNRLHKWCCSNKLTLHPGKTKMVIFGTRQMLRRVRTNPVNLFLSGKLIQNVPTYKYLGFELDATLNYKSHIAEILKKVMHKRSMLSKIMPFLTTEVALLLYKSMILPYFDYCDIVYQSACLGDLDKLQRLQNKCLKTCLGLHRLTDTGRVHVLGKSARLPERRRAHLCNFMYSRLTKSDLVDKRDIRTRNHDAPVFHVVFPHNETFKRSVLYSGALTWNNLPVETRRIDSQLAFKSKQKRLLKIG